MLVELLGIVKGFVLRVEGKHQMLYKDPQGLSGVGGGISIVS